MSTRKLINDPATTYTLDSFISMQLADDMTYYNFSIIEKIGDVQHLDSNLVEIYLEELKSQCVEVKLDKTEFKKYKYRPDLLAYNLYRSVQLDFIILMLNDMYDPKEFTKKSLILPYASTLSSFLDDVYGKEYTYINYNRSVQGIIR